MVYFSASFNHKKRQIGYAILESEQNESQVWKFLHIFSSKTPQKATHGNKILFSQGPFISYTQARKVRFTK